MPGEGPKPFPWLRTWWSSPGKENFTEGFSEAGNSWNKPLGLAHVFQCPYYLGSLTSNQEQMGSASPCPSTFSAMVITSSVTSHHFQGNMLPSRAPTKQQAQTKEGRRNMWLLATWTPHFKHEQNSLRDAWTQTHLLPEVNVGETGEIWTQTGYLRY